MTPEAFFFSVLGKPWESGAAGPDAYDCWGLVRAYWKEVRGEELPDYDVDALNPYEVRREFAGHRDGWREVQPAEGVAVLMGKSERPSHVGILLGQGVLHSTKPSGVVYQDRVALRLHGWRILGYYDR